MDSSLSDEDVNERVASLMAHKSAFRNQASQVNAITVQKKEDEDQENKTPPTPKRRVNQQQYAADKKEITRLEEQLKISRAAMLRYRADTTKIKEREETRKALLAVSEKLRELRNSELIVVEDTF